MFGMATHISSHDGQIDEWRLGREVGLLVSRRTSRRHARLQCAHDSVVSDVLVDGHMIKHATPRITQPTPSRSREALTSLSRLPSSLLELNPSTMAWSSGFVIASALLIHALAQPPIQTDQCFIPSGIATSSYSHYAHTEDPARCVADSGVTSFAGCLEWDRLITSCSSYAKASQASAYYNCYCHQDYLNALYE